MRRLLLALTSLLFAGPACLVDDEIPEGLRELRPEIADARLERAPSGAGRLDFSFRYILAITDERGIGEMRWTYRLVDRDEQVLAQAHQRFREPEPEKTQILVQGERRRTLPVDPGGLRAGETYVLWVSVYYPEEEGPTLVGELLWPVTAP